MGWRNIGQVLVFNSRSDTATYNITLIMEDAQWWAGTDTNQSRPISTAHVLPYDSRGFTLDGYSIYGRTTNSPRVPTWWYDNFITTVVWSRVRGTIVTQKFIRFDGISTEWHPLVYAGAERIDFEGLFTGGVHTVLVVPLYKQINYEIRYYGHDGNAVSGGTSYLPGVSSRLRTALNIAGYRHTHWKDSVTNSTYVPGSNVTLTTMNTRHFTSIFTIINYTISYSNLNGSTHSNITTYNIETSSAALTPPTSRPGYTFAGWYNHISSGSRVYTIAGGTTGNFTLYARWTSDEYTITLDRNGGTTVSNLTYKTDTNNVLLPSITRTGHTLSMWTRYAGPTNGNPTVANNIIYPNGSYGNMSYRADWVANKLHLTYNLSGGPGTPPSGVQISYNDTFTLAPAPTNKTAYTFGGWDYNGVVRSANASVTPTTITTSINSTADVYVTMYAKWNPINYTITIDSNGGSVVSNSTYNIENNTVTINRPTRVGFKFNGWTRTQGPSGGSPTIVDDTITLNSSYGSMTYKAEWTPNVMTINYNLEGGVGTTPSTQTINYNNQFNLATNSDFSKSGYSFSGWTINNTNFNSGAAVFTTTLSSQIESSNVTLEASANWSPIPYTVSFDSMGGSAVSPVIFNITTSKLDLPANPTRAGFLFDGWDVTTGPVTGTFVIEGSDMSFNQATGDITLSAKWATNVFDITWDATGGSSAFPVTGELSNTKPTYYSVTSDTINPTSHIGSLSRPGWNTPVFAPTSIPKGSTGDVTFNINSWSPNIYNITVSSSGTGAGINNATYNTSQNDGAGISRALTKGSRLGYTHGGWSINRTGTFGGDDPTIVGDTLNIPSGSYGNITITQILNIVTYNITYEYNGSTNYEVEGALNNAPTTYNVNTSITYLKNSLNRKGWSFNTNWIQITGRPSGNNIIPQNSIGDKTVSIHWNPVVYNITNSNFGSNTSIGVSNYSTLDANNGDLTYTLTPGSKIGYRDSGWNLSRTGLFGGDAPTISDNTLTIPSGTYGSFNVNKVWTNNTYKLSFDIDGIDVITATYDVNIGNLPNPSRTGYVFNGWSLGGTLVTSTSKNLTAVHDSTLELTSNWTPITYTVVYQTNGVGTLSNKAVNYDVELGTLPTLSKTGYVFDGWFSNNTNDNGSDTEIKDTSINLRSTPGVVTLYAKWTANTYTITYDITKYSLPKTKDITYITGDNNSPLKAKTKQLVLDPAVEGGWNFIGRTVGVGFTYSHSTNTLSIASSQTGDQSINANWSPKTHTITRPVSKTSNTTLTYQTSDSEQTIAIPGPSQPGWTADSKEVTPNTLDITGETGSDTSELTIPANHFGEISITTDWIGNTYTITINTNGGTAVSNKTYTVSAASQTVNILIDENLPVKDGHKRRNWSIKTNPLLGTPTISNNQITIPANTYNNFVVEMLWDVEIYNYSIDFEDGSTSNFNGGYNIGTTVNIPFNVPTKANQTLMGYSSDVTSGQSGSSNVRTRFSPSSGLITKTLSAINLPLGTFGTIELSAIWSGIYYRVTFNKNHATNGTMDPQDKWLGDDEPLTSNDYSEPRYTFAGWARSENGVVEYNDGFDGNVRDANNNLPTSTDVQNPDIITLYAKWDARNIRVNNKIPKRMVVNGNDVIIRTNVIIWNKDGKIV